MAKKYEDLLYPNGTLKNKFNIIDKTDLKFAEENCSSGKMLLLTSSGEMNKFFGNNFEHEHLKKVHKFLLGDVYSWAGEYKQFSLYKGQDILNGRSVNYAPVEFLKDNLDWVFSQLKHTNWKNLTTKEQVLKFADLYQYLWQCHPFNEGNTRTTSVFMKHFALINNIPIDFEKLFQDPKTLRNSFVMYATGDGDKVMNDLFLSCIIDNEQESMLDTKTLPLRVYDFVKSKTSKEELIHKKFLNENLTWRILDLEKEKGIAQANALIQCVETEKIYMVKNFAGSVPFNIKNKKETTDIILQNKTKTLEM